MAKRRGYPDRRGMGAQSDFLSETFVPSEQHRREQLRMAETLIQMGLAPDAVAVMLTIPKSLLTGETEASLEPDQQGSKASPRAS